MANSSTYVEIAPPRPLAPFAERFWIHRLRWPPPPGGRRLLPDGRVNLVWIAGVGVRVAGPQTRYLEPPPLREMLAFGASFRPGAAPYLLRTAASELVDSHVHLDAIDPRFAARLDDRLSAEHEPRRAIAALARELDRRLEERSRPDAVVRQAVEALTDPRATVADAAASAFVSERDLQRRFARYVGYGPKTLQRVLRFQRFLGAMAAGGRDLAATAAAAGYADQAHLSREARRLAGLTPRQLVGWRH